MTLSYYEDYVLDVNVDVMSVNSFPAVKIFCGCPPCVLLALESQTVLALPRYKYIILKLYSLAVELISILYKNIAENKST